MSQGSTQAFLISNGCYNCSPSCTLDPGFNEGQHSAYWDAAAYGLTGGHDGLWEVELGDVVELHVDV